MDRIDNVDLREALGDIARNNTFFHLDNDLNISIEQMERAAKLNDYMGTCVKTHYALKRFDLITFQPESDKNTENTGN